MQYIHLLDGNGVWVAGFLQAMCSGALLRQVFVIILLFACARRDIKMRFLHFFCTIILVYPKKAVPLHRFSAEQGLKLIKWQSRSAEMQRKLESKTPL